MKDILIVGIGSPHGDDQIGWRVVEALQHQLGELPNIEYLCCERTVFQWLNKEQLDRKWLARSIWFVDAIQSNAEPGVLHRIEMITGKISNNTLNISSHGLSVIQAVAIAQALDTLPQQVVVWGIELRRCGITQNISPSVNAGISKLVDLMVQGLRQNIHLVSTPLLK